MEKSDKERSAFAQNPQATLLEKETPGLFDFEPYRKKARNRFLDQFIKLDRKSESYDTEVRDIRKGVLLQTIAEYYGDLDRKLGDADNAMRIRYKNSAGETGGVGTTSRFVDPALLEADLYRELLRRRKIDSYIMACDGERSREEVELCVETARRLGLPEVQLLGNLALCRALQPRSEEKSGGAVANAAPSDPQEAPEDEAWEPGPGVSGMPWGEVWQPGEPVTMTMNAASHDEAGESDKLGGSNEAIADTSLNEEADAELESASTEGGEETPSPSTEETTDDGLADEKGEEVESTPPAQPQDTPQEAQPAPQEGAMGVRTKFLNLVDPGNKNSAFRNAYSQEQYQKLIAEFDRRVEAQRQGGEANITDREVEIGRELYAEAEKLAKTHRAEMAKPRKQTQAGDTAKSTEEGKGAGGAARQPRRDDPRGSIFINEVAKSRLITNKAAADMFTDIVRVPFYIATDYEKFRHRDAPLENKHYGYDLTPDHKDKYPDRENPLVYVPNIQSSEIKVEEARFSESAGHYVIFSWVDAEGRKIILQYCHLEKEPDVRVGDRLRSGQVIGTMGTTGSSRGIHLDLKMKVGKPGQTWTQMKYHDPEKFLTEYTPRPLDEE